MNWTARGAVPESGVAVNAATRGGADATVVVVVVGLVVVVVVVVVVVGTVVTVVLGTVVVVVVGTVVAVVVGVVVVVTTVVVVVVGTVVTIVVWVTVTLSATTGTREIAMARNKMHPTRIERRGIKRHLTNFEGFVFSISQRSNMPIGEGSSLSRQMVL